METPATPPCQHCTHISSAITRALKVWSLVAKLEKNCQIKDKNMTREATMMKHMSNPVVYPDPGSDAVSFIMIKDEDIQALHTPSFMEKFVEIPMFIQRILATFEAKDSDAKKRDASDVKLPSDAVREAKCRCRDISTARPYMPGEKHNVEFADILYNTDNAYFIPLTFFLNRNLQYLIDEVSSLSVTKTNPLLGQTKGVNVINIQKCLPDLPISIEEKDLSYGQWDEAADNHYHFDASCDKEGDEGPYATFWGLHFGFFNGLQDKIEDFPAWRLLEEKHHRKYCSRPMIFN
ncbi:hypothetical protein EDD18DRAFT_1353210 [Armillaria luteobubalina]|uniref:Uncharacterized protein n=1 Tax=Armillaria luteobubalina TaxID=153913 RepID=A0AA39Q575_9AGAR|nr:hypothetical protein EDD18DRAFT_1353210 [Armillaria luteobubalina]